MANCLSGTRKNIHRRRWLFLMMVSGGMNSDDNMTMTTLTTMMVMVILIVMVMIVDIIISTDVMMMMTTTTMMVTVMTVMVVTAYIMFSVFIVVNYFVHMENHMRVLICGCYCLRIIYNTSARADAATIVAVSANNKVISTAGNAVSIRQCRL
jgi:hypothetical protein